MGATDITEMIDHTMEALDSESARTLEFPVAELFCGETAEIPVLRLVTDHERCGFMLSSFFLSPEEAIDMARDYALVEIDGRMTTYGEMFS